MQEKQTTVELESAAGNQSTEAEKEIQSTEKALECNLP